MGLRVWRVQNLREGCLDWLGQWNRATGQAGALGQAHGAGRCVRSLALLYGAGYEDTFWKCVYVLA